ncbi:hypothetical protein pb186bvf_006879 [Paramecium bursaria]
MSNRIMIKPYKRKDNSTYNIIDNDQEQAFEKRARNYELNEEKIKKNCQRNLNGQFSMINPIIQIYQGLQTQAITEIRCAPQKQKMIIDEDLYNNDIRYYELMDIEDNDGFPHTDQILIEQ